MIDVYSGDEQSMSESLPAVAAAVLIVDGRYALQLRDDDPAIAWPAHWSLFGGNLDPGETPHGAIVRELHEELDLAVPACRLLWSTETHRDRQGRIRTLYVFTADITAVWPQHRLGEGQRAELFDGDHLPAPIVPMARAMIERYRRAMG